MRFSGVPFMGLHVAYPDFEFPGIKEPSFTGLGYEDEDGGEESVRCSSPKIPAFTVTKATPKAGRSYAQ